MVLFLGYSFSKEIHFPKDKNGKYLLWPNCCVMIHDFQNIKPGMILLKNPITNENIEISDNYYIPLFSNSFDYYEFGEAMTLTKKTYFNCKNLENGENI